MPRLVGLTASSSSEGRERIQLNASYARAVELAGGIPLIIPAQASLDTLREMMAAADRLLLTGGGDVNPARYGEAAHPAVAGVSDQRDSAEEAVLNLALDRRLPILAICRGMQVLNVALGGTLVQDITSERPGSLVHGPRADHLVQVAPGSRLREILGTDAPEVNSRHHQAIGTLGHGLQAVAWSSDGVVEGIEMPGQWVVGVQWHPEDLIGDSEAARRLFAGFLEAVPAR